jgi:hypothetical protein
MRVASAGVIDREASFIYVYMRCARDVLERGGIWPRQCKRTGQRSNQLNYVPSRGINNLP